MPNAFTSRLRAHLVPEHPRPVVERRKVSIRGREREYVLMRPAATLVSPDRPLPLIVLLHGSFNDGPGILRDMRIRDLVQRGECIVAAPTGIADNWYDVGFGSFFVFRQYEDLDFISHLIEQLPHRYPIDPDQVFLCGVSNGGFMAQTYAVFRPGDIRGLCSIIANLPTGLLDAQLTEVPPYVQYILASNDPLIPYKGGLMHTLISGRVAGAYDSARFWLRQLGQEQAMAANHSLSNSHDRGTFLHRSRWQVGGQLRVELLTVEGGGHQIPGGHHYSFGGKQNTAYSATELMWAFFQHVGTSTPAEEPGNNA